MYDATHNVGDAERLLSLATSLPAAWRGLSSRGPSRYLWLAASALLGWRGLSGSCPVYAAMDVSTAKLFKLPRSYELRHAVLIHTTSGELLDRARANMRRLIGSPFPVAVAGRPGGSGFIWESGPERGSLHVAPTADVEQAMLFVNVDVSSDERLLDKLKLRLARPLVRHALDSSVQDFKAWVEGEGSPGQLPDQ